MNDLKVLQERVNTMFGNYKKITTQHMSHFQEECYMSNRYIVAGVTTDLLLGQNIIVVTSTCGEARDILDAVAGELPEKVEPKVSRVNGMLGLAIKNGGRLRVTAASAHAARGYSADILVVTKWDALSEESRESAIPALAATNGELIRF